MKNIVAFLYAQMRREPSHQAKLAFVVIIIALSMVLPDHSVHASTTPPFGTVLVSGNQWLDGQGVDVHSNNFATYVPNSRYGTEWQCVELAQRLYKQRGWYSGYIFPSTHFAYQIYGNAPSLGFIRHANGDGIPVPGDMIIHAATSKNAAGHVSVVDYVAGGVVHVAEQNASVTGKASYNLSGSTMLNRSGYGTILGYVHAPANQIPTPPPPPSTMVKTASAVPSPLHHPVDFSLHAGTQVAEYNSTTNSFAFQGVWVQPVGTIDWAAAGDFNGDGKADFALHANNAIYVYLSTGSSFAFQGVWVQPVGAFDWGGVGDFNGDGKADFALHANNAIYVYLSTGSSFAFQGVWVQPVGAFDWGGVGDVNGDGKADFALHNNGAIYTYLSTGSSFAFQGVWVQPVGAFDSGWLADFNGS